jgi:phospholipid transport system transporter-binding protein
MKGAEAFVLEAAATAGDYRLSGVLNVDSAAAVLTAGSRAFAGHAAVSVDLGGITHADSAGLSVLLTWVERARHAGQRLVFRELPAPLLRIARLCAVESMLSAAAGG